MSPFKRIRCPTDFSKPAAAALKSAEVGAQHSGAEFLMAHVIPPVPGPHSHPDSPVAFSFDVPLYQQELAIYAEKIPKDLVSHQASPEGRTRGLVTTEETAPEILRIADKEQVDLTVIASQDLTGGDWLSAQWPKKWCARPPVRG